MDSQHLHPMAPRDDDEIEAELTYLPGSGPSMDPEYYDPHAAPPGFVTAFWNPYEVKHRRRTSRAQLTVLESEFESDPKPNADKRRTLATQLHMTPRAIQVWFQNRRAKIKAIKNKIPGGRGMPKLKPGEKAMARAARTMSVVDDEPRSDEKSDLWVELSPDDSPLTSPAEPAFSPKPQFTIAVPSGGSPVSGPPSPSFPQSELLAPPSAAAMLRRGSAPAPLQGIHRARYSIFNRPGGNPELDTAIPHSPISPPDHQVAPLRRASASHAPLGRRPSLPDSHLRLPAHPYYPHASAPRMQRRGGLLSPVPDEEQAPYNQLPTMLPPAPTLGSSRIYRALPPGMGAVPAAHDLPTQFPTRPGVFGSCSGSYAPARPLPASVPGPLPAADFSFGAPEPGHGEAFNRAMEREPASATSEYNPSFNHSNPDFNHPNPDFNHSNPDFNHPGPDFTSNLWDARTRFGSMASIASDVTGVSVSSTQATSISSGLAQPDCHFGYPGGFQPDVRRASCPGEFLHQFSGMGVNNEVAGPTPIRPSPLGRSLTIAPDSRLVHDAKSLCSPTFPPGQVDPTFPPPTSFEGQESGQGQHMSGQHMSGQHMNSSQHLPQNNQHLSNGQLHMSPTDMSPISQQHMAQANLTPDQRSLVGGGFGSEPYLGYDSRTPPSFEASPNLAGVDILANVDALGGMTMGNKDGQMLFNADGPYDINVMPMIGQNYTGDFNF